MFAVVVDFVEFAYQILTVDNANAIIRKSQLKMKWIYRSYCKFITSPWPYPVHQQMLSFLVCLFNAFLFLGPSPTSNSKREGKTFWGFPSSLSLFSSCSCEGGETHSSFPPSSLYFGSRSPLWPTFTSFHLNQAKWIQMKTKTLPKAQRTWGSSSFIKVTELK